mgnify:CR=1 FL=1
MEKIEKIEEVVIKQADEIIGELAPNGKHIEKCIIHERPICTNTAAFMRLPIFPAVQTSSMIELETQWGQVIVENPASQRHLDLLECILYLAHKIEKKGNRIVVHVDSYKLQRKLAKTGERISQQRVLKMIKNLEDVRLTTKHIISSYGQKVSVELRGRIIDTTTTVSATARNRKSKTVIVITFGDMVSADLWLDRLFLYDPEKIVKLRHSYTKAIVRFLLSHKTNENKKWELKRLLQHLSIYVNKDDNDSKGIVISKEQYKKIIRRLKEEAKELNEMGITIEKKHNEYYIVCDAHKLQNALETK